MLLFTAEGRFYLQLRPSSRPTYTLLRHETLEEVLQALREEIPLERVHTWNSHAGYSTQSDAAQELSVYRARRRFAAKKLEGWTSESVVVMEDTEGRVEEVPAEV